MVVSLSENVQLGSQAEVVHHNNEVAQWDQMVAVKSINSMRKNKSKNTQVRFPICKQSNRAKHVNGKPIIFKNKITYHIIFIFHFSSESNNQSI